MTTWNFGTDADHKFADMLGLALVNAVLRADAGGGDDILIRQQALPNDANTVFLFEFGATQGYLDQGPNGNDITTVSGAILGENGYRFDNLDDYLRAPDDDTLDLTNDWCLEAWVFLNSVGVNSQSKVISKANAEYSLAFKTTGMLNATIGNTSRDSSASAYATGSYQHVAASHVAGDLVRFWGQGGAKGTTASTNAAAGANNLYIGNVAAGNRCLDGIVDEVAAAKVGRYTEPFTPHRFPASGTLTGVIDGGVSQDWSNISHTRTVAGDYEGSISQLRYRAGATNPPTGDWTTVATPAVSEDIDVTGRYLQVEFALAPKADTNRTETPRLLTLSVAGEASGGGGTPQELAALAEDFSFFAGSLVRAVPLGAAAAITSSMSGGLVRAVPLAAEASAAASLGAALTVARALSATVSAVSSMTARLVAGAVTIVRRVGGQVLPFTTGAVRGLISAGRVFPRITGRVE